MPGDGHPIGPMIEPIPIQPIDDACKAIEKAEVRLRYLVDMASLKEGANA